MTVAVGTIYRLRVTALGSSIKVYVDDMATPKINVTDATYATGATGLRVFNKPEGYEAMAAPRTGQRTFEALDQAIKQILDECYAEAKRIINEKRAEMERVTDCLLQQETLSREEFVALM
jgi:ATP-dependent Zn protease